MTSRLPKGFHFITVSGALCWLLLEKVDEGRALPSASQQDTMPSAQPMDRMRPLGCQSSVSARAECVMLEFGIRPPCKRPLSQQ